MVNSEPSGLFYEFERAAFLTGFILLIIFYRVALRVLPEFLNKVPDGIHYGVGCCLGYLVPHINGFVNR